MRVLIIVLSAVLVLAAIAKGLMLVIKSATAMPEGEQGKQGDGEATPSSEAPSPHWTESPTVRLAIILLVILVVLLGITTVLETPERPPDNYEPPRMENGEIAPGRAY